MTPGPVTVNSAPHSLIRPGFLSIFPCFPSRLALLFPCFSFSYLPPFLSFPHLCSSFTCTHPSSLILAHLHIEFQSLHSHCLVASLAPFSPRTPPAFSRKTPESSLHHGRSTAERTKRVALWWRRGGTESRAQGARGVRPSTRTIGQR